MHIININISYETILPANCVLMSLDKTLQLMIYDIIRYNVCYFMIYDIQYMT